MAIEAERSREDAELAAAHLAALRAQQAPAEDLEAARLQAEAAEVSAVQAMTRLTLSRQSRATLNLQQKKP